MLPPLYAAHFNPAVVDDITGITPFEQNRWVVAATVYDSVARSGKVG
jgi:hypothetical protein